MELGTTIKTLRFLGMWHVLGIEGAQGNGEQTDWLLSACWQEVRPSQQFQIAVEILCLTIESDVSLT